MEQLPTALQGLAQYRQFVLYRLVPKNDGTGKVDKWPCDLTGNKADAHDIASQHDFQSVATIAALFGPEWGVGFVFTENDPFYFFDVDDCLTPDSQWTPRAVELMQRFGGAAVEVSQSGKGLHIIGTGSPTVPKEKRRTKSVSKDFDLYTGRRFVALTGNGVVGDVNAPVDQAQLDYIVDSFLLQISESGIDDWTTEPVEAWNGPEDDAELIEKALATKPASATFGQGVAFADLWNCNVDKLARNYPNDQGTGEYDASSVDAALAQHLAFWTGSNCERMKGLMLQSELVREKWDREDYLIRTIMKAVSMQTSFYSAPNREIDEAGAQLAEMFGAVKIKASSDAQREYAECIRARKLAECHGEEQAIKTLCRQPLAHWWIDNEDKAADELLAMVTPIDHADSPIWSECMEPELVSGFQFLGATQQLELFKGCVYVQDIHRAFLPDGSLVKPEQFKCIFGGYTFQIDDNNKTTRNAWEAFTESQVIRFPKAKSSIFTPEKAPCALTKDQEGIKVNTYVPVDTPRKAGDPEPFLIHLAKVLPDPRDQEILLSYMAGCIQYKGVKFQWAPLIQGVEGNGKTLFTRCVAYAIGRKYTHYPKAADIDNKFNGWLMNKLFIGVEDIYVPDHRREVIETLKPMITGGDGIEIQQKGSDQVTVDICANFMLNSNHKDGLRKTHNDRRFAPFYTAQQQAEDLARDGMDGEYFPNLYDWLKGTGRHAHEGAFHGYAVVHEYLASYAIPDELNPATTCMRAPVTTSTEEAILAGRGGVEQEILEAIEEGRQGFAGGWVSSVAMERLLDDIRATRQIPPNKRRELMRSLGYDWHPALKDGRVNNPIALDGGKKPRIFIRKGHIHSNLTAPAEVARHYIEAQQGAVAPSGDNSKAQKVFNNV